MSKRDPSAPLVLRNAINLLPYDIETLEAWDTAQQEQRNNIVDSASSFISRRETDLTAANIAKHDLLRKKRIAELVANPELMFALYRETWKRYFRRRLDEGVTPEKLFERKRTHEGQGHPEMLPDKETENVVIRQEATLAKESRDAILAYCAEDTNDYRYRSIVDRLHEGAVSDIRSELSQKLGTKRT